MLPWFIWKRINNMVYPNRHIYNMNNGECAVIRVATIKDLPQVTEIYNQAIDSKKSTADMHPLTIEQRETWFFEHTQNKRTPILVYEENDVVVGYYCLSAYRPGRQALESIAELSYYVDFRHHRKGIGDKLLLHSMQQAQKLEYKNLLAIIISCNEGSAALLRKNGFQLWGTLPNIVYIESNVYSHLYYGLKLQE